MNDFCPPGGPTPEELDAHDELIGGEIPDRPLKTSSWTDEAIDKERAKDAEIVAGIKKDEKQGIEIPPWLFRSYIPGTIITHNGVDAKIMGVDCMPDGVWVAIITPHEPATKPKATLKAEYHRLTRLHGKKKAKKLMRERDIPTCLTCGVDESAWQRLTLDHKSRSEHRRLVALGKGEAVEAVPESAPTGDTTSTESDELSLTKESEE